MARLLPTITEMENFVHGMGDAVRVGGLQRIALAKQILGFETLRNETMLLNRGLDDQIGFNQALITTYVGLAAKSMVFEARNKELNKTFGINSMSAAKLSMTIHTLANEQGFSGAQAIKYANSIKKLLPSLEQQGKEHDKTYESLQRIQHVLTTNLGLTEAATEAYTLYASKNGENADATLQFASSLATVLHDEDGTMGYMKQAIEGIAEAGAETQLQFGKLPGNLEVATIKATALGFKLDELSDAGNHLLDIESSIGQELEYQLLSGHRLVGNDKASEKLRGKSLTNAYREATLRGNMSDAASTLNTILDQEGEVLENNLFARKQMADLLGIEEGQLSRALQKKKLLTSDEGLSVLMDLDGTELQRAADEMLKSGAMSKEVFTEMTKLNDTRTTDDIMKQQLVVAHESLATFKAILGADQEDQVKIQRELLTSQTGIKGIQDLMLDFNNKDLTTLGKTLTLEDMGGRFKKSKAEIAAGKTPAHQSKEVGALVAETDTGEDTVVPPGFGSRILTFPEDTLQPNIAFSDKDNIMATTQTPTFGGDMEQSGGNNSYSEEYLSLAKAMASPTFGGDMEQSGRNNSSSEEYLSLAKILASPYFNKDNITETTLSPTFGSNMEQPAGNNSSSEEYLSLAKAMASPTIDSGTATLQPNIAYANKDNVTETTLPPTFNSSPTYQPIYGGDMGQSAGNKSSSEEDLSLAKALTQNNSSATPGGATDASIMAIGRMIVAAINSKGSNLFGATSMNDSTY